MSEAQHTPGPWKAEPARPGRECHWTISTVKKYQGQGRAEYYELPIAMVSNGWFKYDGNQGKAETTANTYLIAASPALLSACEEALTMLRIFYKKPDIVLANVIKQLESAINDAKPKGKE